MAVTGRHSGALGNRAGEERPWRGAAVSWVIDRLVLTGTRYLQQGETVSQQVLTILPTLAAL